MVHPRCVLRSQTLGYKGWRKTEHETIYKPSHHHHSDGPQKYWSISVLLQYNWFTYIGSAMPFQTRLTQTKLVLPLSNEHGSQVKDQGQQQSCHNKHKKFPYRPTSDVSLISGHASYKHNCSSYDCDTQLHCEVSISKFKAAIWNK